MSASLPTPSSPFEFRCLGFMRGIYRSSDSADPFAPRGHLLIPEENLEIPAFIINKSLSNVLRKQPTLIEEAQLWTVYPRTFWNGQHEFRVQIKHLKTELELSEDIFSLRGVLSSYDPQKQVIELQIRRNLEVSDKKRELPKYQSFPIHLQGILPTGSSGEAAVPGQFWEILVRREGTQLMLQEANLVGMLTLEKPSTKPSPTASPQPKRNPRPTPGPTNTGKVSKRPSRFPIAPKVMDLRTKKTDK